VRGLNSAGWQAIGGCVLCLLLVAVRRGISYGTLSLDLPASFAVLHSCQVYLLSGMLPLLFLFIGLCTNRYGFATCSTLKPTQWSYPSGSINQIPGSATVSGDMRVTPFYDVEEVRNQQPSFQVECRLLLL
jgi:hypothetical protein